MDTLTYTPAEGPSRGNSQTADDGHLEAQRGSVFQADHNEPTNSLATHGPLASTGPPAAPVPGCHTRPVTSLACSPDGVYAASGSYDDVIIIWEVANGQSKSVCRGHTGQIFSLSFSPDSKELVSGGEDSQALIWTLEKTKEFRVKLKGHDYPVLFVSYSPKGSMILTASVDMTARVWDASDGHQISRFDGHDNAVNQAKFTPDEMKVVSCDFQDTAVIWDAQTGEQIWRLRNHESIVWCLSLSPDGRRCITGSEDGTGKIWSTETGDELRTLNGHRGPVQNVAFSPDGRLAFAASIDVKVCDSFSGEVVLHAHGTDRCIPAFSADGKRVVVVKNNMLELWDVEKRSVVASSVRRECKTEHVVFTPDGQHVISAMQDGHVYIWNLDTLVQT